MSYPCSPPIEDQRPGGASVGEVDLLSGNAGRSVTRIDSALSRLGGRGCVSNIRALTVAVTQSHHKEEREGGRKGEREGGRKGGREEEKRGREEGRRG